jgi:hypothetical protein
MSEEKRKRGRPAINKEKTICISFKVSVSKRDYYHQMFSDILVADKIKNKKP